LESASPSSLRNLDAGRRLFDYHGGMKCPGCNNERSLQCLGATEQTNECAYRCVACDRLFLVTVTDVTDIVPRYGSIGVESIELEKLRNKLVSQLAQVDSQIAVVRGDYNAAKRFTRARNDNPPA
jgi:transcription elongation factor Elf1